VHERVLAVVIFGLGL